MTDDLINYDAFSLRKFTNGQDAESLFKALKDPEVVRHMVSSGISQTDCSAIIEDSIRHWQDHGIGSWAVLKNNQVIGWAGFKIWQDEEFELLIVLGKNSWGLGKIVYSELIKLARERYHLKSLVVVLPETRKSFQFIVKRAGFQSVGSVEYQGEAFQKFVLQL